MYTKMSCAPDMLPFSTPSALKIISPLIYSIKIFFQIDNGTYNYDSSCTPDWLELPGAIILLTVVAPGVFADTFRGQVVGVLICLAIGCYLLQEHIRASGGFRNAFTRGNGVSNSIGILLLFIYPVWTLVLVR
jgi:hypothetical protein